MTASSPTDRRDADDATFAAELARLDRLDVADEDNVERVARAIAPAWGHNWDHILPSLAEDYRRLARAAIAALKPAPGTDTADPNACRWCGVGEREHASRFTPSAGQHVYATPTDAQRLARMRNRLAPGTGTPDQAVQRDETVLIGDAWSAAATREQLEAECNRLSELAGFNLRRAWKAEQAVQCVLDLIDPANEMASGNGYNADRMFTEQQIRAAVAGPQRDHDEEGGQ